MTTTTDGPAARAQTALPAGVRNEVFQTSLMSALLDGIYDGETTIAELLSHGNFGLGTFNGLDGEMIVLDGRCYQMRVDGSCRPADLGQLTPFAVVTNFVPTITHTVTEQMTRAQVSSLIDSLTVSPNYLYALRITGQFHWVKTRTVQLQSKPYKPMTKATDNEPTVDFHDESGIVAGFRTPLYEQGISVPGCHVHFITDARTSGGHVLDFTLDHGTIELCLGTDLRVSLPRTPAFEAANLSPEDLEAQLHATEQHS